MELAAPIQWTMSGVFVTLVTASMTTATLSRWRPSWDLAEVRLRVRSWWVMAGAFIAALLVHRAITVVFLAAIGVAAVLELARVVKMVRAVAVVATMCAYGLAATGEPGLLGWAMPAAALIAAVVLVLRGDVDGFVSTVGGTALGAMVGLSLAHMAALLALPVSSDRPGGGAGLLLMLVIVAQGGDVAQYLAGKALGRRPLAPAVSPNKTIAGLVGGVMVAGLLGGVFTLALADYGFMSGLLLGVAIAIAGAMGDLVVSAIKRDSGIKDCGTLIPGHGGVLDRVDSLLLAAPLFFYVVTL